MGSNNLSLEVAHAAKPDEAALRGNTRNDVMLTMVVHKGVGAETTGKRDSDKVQPRVRLRQQNHWHSIIEEPCVPYVHVHVWYERTISNTLPGSVPATSRKNRIDTLTIHCGKSDLQQDKKTLTGISGVLQTSLWFKPFAKYLHVAPPKEHS